MQPLPNPNAADPDAATRAKPAGAAACAGTNRFVGDGRRDAAADALPAFDAFCAEALAAGCDEVIERTWPSGAVIETHTHPFGAEALVVQGEMWLTEDGRTRHLARGGTFRLAAGVPHAERYGPEGATYWVGRRSAPPA